MMTQLEKLTPRQTLQTLDRFWDQIRHETLLEDKSAKNLDAWRWTVFLALKELLVWQRPFLIEHRGLSWPYRMLKKQAHYFENHLTHPDAFVRRQALLFLALLPFPGQWRRLLRLESNQLMDSEVKTFLNHETGNIKEKVRDKPQRSYYLKNFCQVLKKPVGPHEKGVLRIFSLPYLFAETELLERLSTLYFLFVEPPMGVLFRHSWWRLFAARPDNCLFGVAGPEDADFLQSQGIVNTSRLAHGEFLEEQILPVHQKQPPYDIIFNATFDDMRRKRHRLMLDLLQHPLLSHRTALFIGRGKQINIDQLQSEINARGLQDRTHIKANLLRRDVPRYLALGKIGVHLSLYENACRCVYEYFRSNLPCVVSTAMAGIRPELFNQQTGMAVNDEKLPDSIATVLDRRVDYQPRKWFLANTGTTHSTNNLNRRLQQIFIDNGWSWTQDIVPAVSSGASRYLLTSDYEHFALDFEWLFASINHARSNSNKNWTGIQIKADHYLSKDWGTPIEALG